MECLSDDLIGSLLSRTLAFDELKTVENHIAACSDCESLLAELARRSAFESQREDTSSNAFFDSEKLAIGHSIGRYVILRRLGVGAMGAVFLAYDPELDRSVAIKVLTSAEDRHLLTEAKALARITHPNIVAMYEIGEHSDGKFIVMQWIDGLELTLHWSTHVSTWQTGFQLLCEAAAGLQAVHDTGLVHRDISPRNILVDSNGHARVGDFGLAVSTGHLPSALVGTPGYIAPEQVELTPAQVSADQYSLCAVFLALFRDSSFNSPQWLFDALERGTHDSPEKRFSSCADMVLFLDRKKRAPKRLAVIGAFVVVAAVSALVLSYRASDHKPSCAEGGSIFSEAIGERLAAVDFPTHGDYGKQTTARVQSEFKEYGVRWGNTRDNICRATHYDGGQSQNLLELRITCLDRRLVYISALVERLTGEKRDDLADRSIGIILSAPPPELCEDAVLSSAWPRPKDGTAAAKQWQQGDEALLNAEASLEAGLPVEAAKAVFRVLPSIGEFPPLLAQAEYIIGGSYDAESVPLSEAQEHLEKAMLLAAQAQDDALTAKILQRLLFIVGTRMGRPDDALAYEGVAHAALVRAGSPGKLVAKLHYNLGSVLLRSGDYSRAAKKFSDATNNLDELMGAMAHIGQCQALNYLGEFENAKAVCIIGLAALESVLPALHPKIVAARFALAAVHTELGDLQIARQEMERGVESFRARYGNKHPRVATALQNLSVTFERLGDFEAMEQTILEVLEIRRQALGSEHPRMATALQSLGLAQMELKKYSASRKSLGEALTIGTSIHGGSHPDIALTLNSLGELELTVGELDRAHRYLSAAIAIYAENPMPLPDIISSLALRAEVLFQQGQRSAAIGDLKRAMQVSGLTEGNIAALESKLTGMKKRKMR